ncbi:MAG TPA: DUF6076 domain-containing protein [Clostridiaceae bacterium]|nr:DUF6076 domain-containing protein [Clostridiaceae bacterium]
MEMLGLLQHFKNDSYEMIINLAKEKPRVGTEKFVITNRISPFKNQITKKAKDDFGEKRERKNILGATLTNLINSFANIIDIIDTYIVDIDNLTYKKYDEFFKKALSIIEKNGINKISDYNKYYLEMIDYISDENDINIESFPNISLINELMLNTKSEDMKRVCKTFSEIYELKQNTEVLIEDWSMEMLTDTLIVKRFSKNEYSSFIQNYCINGLYYLLENFSNDIEKVLGENNFLLQSLVYNVVDDMQAIQYDNKNLPTYKNYVKNKALVEDTENTYFVMLNKYFDKNINTSLFGLLKNISTIFLMSLIVDLDTLCDFNKEGYFRKVHLPQVDIISSTVQSLESFEYKYKISTIKEFIDVSSFSILADRSALIKCHNCGRFFISDTRKSEVYCKRIDLNDPKKRRCNVIGVEKTRWHASDSRTNLYRRISSRLRKNPNKYKGELEKFLNEYHNYEKILPTKYKKTAYDNDFKDKKLKEWLIKYDENLQKKYPSNRMG